ncbi:MBL fold metallo-hydrolase [Paenibacillus sp. tmac-D7]|uniref:MBL fold metallo-hydrolase n=1 Tax=Paenibacillus sp. tmac-D7 TaxID=2591462 RepID=UPI001143377D|nr:MBL fold metallo-hydrolase [Paenibacillus sp. tmac-D7]
MYSVHKDGYGFHQITLPTLLPVGPVNVLVIERNGKLTLIDAGINTDEAFAILQSSLGNLGYSLTDLERIVLTHHHPDHIGLINRIAERCKIPVLAHPLAVPRLTRDPEYLSFRCDFFDTLYREMGCGELGAQRIEQMKRSMVENKHEKVTAEIIEVDEGGNIQGLDSLEPIYAPGHSPDHLMFYDRQRKVMAAGDHLLPKISSNALVEPDIDGNRLPSLALYRESLLKCRELAADIVFPGHGEAFGQHAALIDSRLSRMDEKADRVKELIKLRAKTPFELAKEMYPTEYRRQFTFVMSEVIGMLDYMETNLQIEKVFSNHVWSYAAKD